VTEWTEGFQRAYLAALLNGMVGHRLDALAVSLFSEERAGIASAIHAFHEKRNEWPSFDILPALLGEDALSEIERMRRQTRGAQQHAAEEGGLVLRREALRAFALQVDESATSSPEAWGGLPKGLSEALSLGQAAPPPFSYAEGLTERHVTQRHAFTAPTGVAPLDEAREGGLHEGELGFILGGTNVGKSQLVIHFGAAHLLTGGYVLHVSLEMPAGAVAARYDRNILGMDKWEIMENLKRAEALRNEKVDPKRLDIRVYPRGGLGIPGLYSLVQETKQRWQALPLLIVDYFSLLKGNGSEDRHREVAQISADLSALAQSEGIGIWSPFQVNRGGYKKHGGESRVGLEDAGESYAATQHPDYLIAMNQSDTDRAQGKMFLEVTKDRSYQFARANVRVDWARSRVVFERNAG